MIIIVIRYYHISRRMSSTTFFVSFLYFSLFVVFGEWASDIQNINRNNFKPKKRNFFNMKIYWINFISFFCCCFVLQCYVNGHWNNSWKTTWIHHRHCWLLFNFNNFFPLYNSLARLPVCAFFISSQLYKLSNSKNIVEAMTKWAY